MRLFALFTVISGLLFLSWQATAAETPAEIQQKRQLVERYVSEQQFEPLYEKVLAQYTAFAPASRMNQATSLVQNPDFRSRIFGLTRDQLVATYTLPELQAEANFLDTPAGKSILQQVNDRGLSFRANTDLSPQDLQDLRAFHATPIGQSIKQKTPGFTTGLLSQVFKTFLLYQSNL